MKWLGAAVSEQSPNAPVQKAGHDHAQRRQECANPGLLADYERANEYERERADQREVRPEIGQLTSSR